MAIGRKTTALSALALVLALTTACMAPPVLATRQLHQFTGQHQRVSAFLTALRSGDAQMAGSSLIAQDAPTAVLAQTLVQSAAGGSSQTVGAALAQAAAQSTGATANVMAQAAATAVSTGRTASFAAAQAHAFGFAMQNGNVNAFSSAVAQAM
jgi:hypothetical protein